LFLGLSSIAFTFQPARGQTGSIYINPNGSITPSTANITTSDNVTYIFTDNNYLPIVVQRSNIIINGAGHTLQASQGNGFSLMGVDNVTIKKTVIADCRSDGVYIYSSSNNIVTANDITRNGASGIYFLYSSGNTVSGNTITANNYSGIDIDSSGNTVSSNNVAANNRIGIELNYGGNFLSGNTITANNGTGIYLAWFGNTLSGNIMTNNTYNFGVAAPLVNKVTTSNLVNGKPVYYLMNQSSITISPLTYPGGVGYLALIGCKNVTVQGLTLANNVQGLLLANTNNSKIVGNNFSKNAYDGVFLNSSFGNVLSGNNVTRNAANGVYLSYSTENALTSNNITANSGAGIWLDDRSDGNTFSRNTIKANGGDGIHSDLFRVDYGMDYGWGFFPCNNNTLSDNNFMANNGTGIYLDCSSDNILLGNNVTSNGRWGIYLQGIHLWIMMEFTGDIFSSSNHLIGNNIIANSAAGLQLNDYSRNCTFFHNNFVNNTQQVQMGGAYGMYDGTHPQPNTWDNGYPSGGNYWSDYPGLDLKSGPHQNQTGSDGMGDTPYAISTNNIDLYPLTTPFGSHLPLAFPHASFLYTPTEPTTTQLVTLNASTSTCSNGSIKSYEWDFGDGASGFGQTVSHLYTSHGNYTVTLTATSDTFISNSKQQIIIVREAPYANFSVSSTLLVGSSILFNASNSKPLGGCITDYVWDFGDSNQTSTTTLITSHVYSTPGQFVAKLTVLDSEGLNSTVSKSLLIKMPTSISISTISTSATVGFVVNINGTSSDFYNRGINNQTVIIYYTFSGVQSWLPITSSRTDSYGHFYVQWIPTATGYFTIKAAYPGNSTYLGTNATITVSTIPYLNQYMFTVESNSTISNLTFNSTNNILGFTASGENDTIGYAKVTIPKSLLPDQSKLKVIIDGTGCNYTARDLTNSWVITFTYSHSAHQVQIELGQSSPIESFLLAAVLLAIVVMVALFGAIIYNRKHRPFEKNVHPQIG
jgi:parallel beta-helix repeat protein